MLTFLIRKTINWVWPHRLVDGDDHDFILLPHSLAMIEHIAEERRETWIYQR